MFQYFLRKWLMNAAAQKVREAAAQSAAEKGADARPAAELDPRVDAKPVCHVGIVFAMPIEVAALVDQMAGVIRIEAPNFKAREGGLRGKRLLAVDAGVGAAAARKATAALIDGHKPRWVISAGFAGAVSDRLKQGDILLA